MKKMSKKFLLIFSLSIFVLTVITAQVYYTLPQKITFMQYEPLNSCLFNSFVRGKVSENSMTVSQSNDPPVTVDHYGDIQLDTSRVGVYSVEASFMGIFPLKQVSVEVREPMRLVVGGNLLGMKMDTDGIVVVGLSHVVGSQSQKITPMEHTGIEVGDQIETLDGREMDSITALVSAVEQSQGKKLKVGYRHKGENKETMVTPAKSSDGSYKLGAWVRDSSAGIGTMTFYNPQNDTFGALGHSICDVDTGEKLPVEKGIVLPCTISRIQRSAKGSPGRLEGALAAPAQYGTIVSNSDIGIYGHMTAGDFKQGSLMEVGSRFSVQEGNASILCSLDGKTVEEYQISIEKKSGNTVAQKGMIIRITDPKLLQKTGGIVQGMSGSPIIQNGKLVGAVTHVFINDPTRGYGIFIENMLDECSRVCC